MDDYIKQVTELLIAYSESGGDTRDILQIIEISALLRIATALEALKEGTPDAQ